jgi:S-adenosylmethionine:tRNA ribosyltransferase-isomerase
MDVSDFDYDLPEALIAQFPPVERGDSRLLVLELGDGRLTHAAMPDLERFLGAGDLLVLNNTRVFPARLIGRRVPSGGAVECLLLRQLDDDRWEALVHPGQKLRPGGVVAFGSGPGIVRGEILERRFFGRRVVRLWTEDGSPIAPAIDRIGHVPLPPYIRRPADRADSERYQTVYARRRGSVAAPTAGLHLTRDLLDQLSARGVEQAEITLHIGYGTFKPVRVDRVEDHTVDAESYDISEEAARLISRAQLQRRRIVAVGTTTVRALESAAIAGGGEVTPGEGTTDLFIHPGFDFKVVGGLLTNFHLPRSSLLMLVAAFGGRHRVLATYREAVARGYRFYSYGDAMLVIKP